MSTPIEPRVLEPISTELVMIEHPEQGGMEFRFERLYEDGVQRFSIYYDAEQLVEIRDVLTAYLEREQ